MSAELFDSSTLHVAVGAVKDEPVMRYRRGTAAMTPGRIEVTFGRGMRTAWTIVSVDVSGVRVGGVSAGHDARHTWTKPTEPEIDGDMPAWARTFIAEHVPVGEISY